MKKNTYKVVVQLKETETLKGSINILEEYAYTAMDVHKSVQDKIDWRLQEITEIYFVTDVNNNTGELVYTLKDGFIGE